MANQINDQETIKYLVEAIPMTTTRMPTSFSGTFNGGFAAPNASKSFTSQRPVRVKDAVLSSDSSEEDLTFSDGRPRGVPQVEKPKKSKGNTSVKNSRSWIQFRELS